MFKYSTTESSRYRNNNYCYTNKLRKVRKTWDTCLKRCFTCSVLHLKHSLKMLSSFIYTVQLTFLSHPVDVGLNRKEVYTYFYRLIYSRHGVYRMLVNIAVFFRVHIQLYMLKFSSLLSLDSCVISGKISSFRSRLCPCDLNGLKYTKTDIR